LFLKPIAKRLATVVKRGFLFWNRKHVSKIGYQTGSIFLNQNQPEISPKILLDLVSSKNNVVFKTAVKWMPKKNISNAAIHKA
jgi:hypothetical protein